jgi:hypothetical protein
MTRKDYIIIAEALRVQYRRALNTVNACETDKTLSRHAADGFCSGVLYVTEEIADSLQRDNSRFNREHFLAVVRGEKELLSRPSRSGVQS